MNQMQLFRQRRQVRDLLRMSNRYEGVLKWSPTETDAHVLMKFEICKWLKFQGKQFYCEAIFEGSGLRADVVNADDGVIYEVVESESQASIAKKMQGYPLPIIVVKAEQQFNEKLIL
jgi:hypothetical protein